MSTDKVVYDAEKNQIVINPKGDELTIRHGEAPKLTYPEINKYSANIYAPYIYAESQILRKLIDDKYCLVFVDRDKKEIRFNENPKDEYSTLVTGKLELSKEVKSFFINEDKQFTLEELIKFLRLKRMHFTDPKSCTDLVAQLQNFKAKISIEINKANDNRGNIKRSVEQIAETGLPTTFELFLPVFKGTGNKHFTVNIFYDIKTSSSTEFWFESMELNDLVEQSNEYIDEEIKKFNGLNIPVIEV